jgi:acyl-CoA-binding protein
MLAIRGLEITTNYFRGTCDTFLITTNDGSSCIIKPVAEDTIASLLEKMNTAAEKENGVKFKYQLPLEPTNIEIQFEKSQQWICAFAKLLLARASMGGSSSKDEIQLTRTLLALYKQSTEGDATKNKPWFFRRRWNEHNKLRGMSKKESMERFVAACEPLKKSTTTIQWW